MMMMMTAGTGIETEISTTPVTFQWTLIGFKPQHRYPSSSSGVIWVGLASVIIGAWLELWPFLVHCKVTGVISLGRACDCHQTWCQMPALWQIWVTHSSPVMWPHLSPLSESKVHWKVTGVIFDSVNFGLLASSEKLKSPIISGFGISRSQKLSKIFGVRNNSSHFAMGNWARSGGCQPDIGQLAVETDICSHSQIVVTWAAVASPSMSWQLQSLCNGKWHATTPVTCVSTRDRIRSRCHLTEQGLR